MCRTASQGAGRAPHMGLQMEMAEKLADGFGSHTSFEAKHKQGGHDQADEPGAACLCFPQRLFGRQGSRKTGSRRPSPRPGGPGRGRACCHGSLGSTKSPTRAARGGKPRGRGPGQRCAARVTRTSSPSGWPPMAWPIGTRGPRSRSRLFSAPRQRWKAATVRERTASTLRGDDRSSATRGGPCCRTSRWSRPRRHDTRGAVFQTDVSGSL